MITNILPSIMRIQNDLRQQFYIFVGYSTCAINPGMKTLCFALAAAADVAEHTALLSFVQV